MTAIRSAFSGTRLATVGKATLQALSRQFKRLGTDRQGFGAVEFALLFPLLLFVYLSALELTLAFSVQKRATAAASTVADLIAQEGDVNKDFLDSMTHVAQSLFVPYPTTGMVLKVTGITIDKNSKATVTWSWESDSKKAPYTAGTTLNLDAAMSNAETFLIHAELSIPHELVTYVPNFSSSGLTTITIARDYYYRQRVGDDGIACTNCPS
ncbi:TadE/TadG family type IV pilus assembly protein [Rhizobium halophytocola]|uniref:Flp pilus assembly protein TadG n=1 Tax=Rhizobium halophytocola TaxID=735519 RepID=A0ABS4E1D2_9HYPH|nr:TadE/TadG family type IV pilus assembly protein [Rhizobium halophytocola]MBP1851745.1 Flp pilus assembly protein TadG [Rhizobium halophytocola]